MDTKEFIAYIKDCKRQGLDNGQIAKRLGIKEAELRVMCDNAFSESNIPQKEVKVVENEIIKKPVEKPVSGAAEPKREPRKKVEEITFVPQNDDKTMN